MSNYLPGVEMFTTIHCICFVGIKEPPGIDFYLKLSLLLKKYSCDCKPS